MARTRETHPWFRTKHQMAEDVLIALTSEMSIGGKVWVISKVCWEWTELQGKYKGCRLWTPTALRERDSNPLPDPKKFRHEHAVPKTAIYALLLGLENPSIESVFALCDRMLLGVVVTRDEDRVLNAGLRQRMPREFDDPVSTGYRDPWLRYKHKRIQVVRATEAGFIPAFEMPPPPWHSPADAPG